MNWRGARLPALLTFAGCEKQDAAAVDEDTGCIPGGEEVPYDGRDNDCDATTPDDDLDGDGYGHAEDCSDTDPGIGEPDQT